MLDFSHPDLDPELYPDQQSPNLDLSPNSDLVPYQNITVPDHYC